MQDEGVARGALGSIAMRVAELRRPGEVEQVVVEAGALRQMRGRAVCGCGRPGGTGVGIGSRLAGAEHDEKREDRGNGRVLHAAQDSR